MCEEEMYDVNGGVTATLYVPCTIDVFLSSANVSSIYILTLVKLTTIVSPMGDVLGILISLATVQMIH